MPKTSLDSVRHDAVPLAEVLGALRLWAAELRAARPEVVRVGFFGSYARGDYLPASDLDVLVEVTSSQHTRWWDRPVDFAPVRSIPVGVELFIYTSDEILRMQQEKSTWLHRILAEAVWV